MAEQTKLYDSSFADGRFQYELLALRWALIGLYALFSLTGLIDVDLIWFAISEGFLVTFNLYYTWYTWRDLSGSPLPQWAGYATPFLDTVSVTAALLAIGDPLHPIWAAYFFILVGAAFYYYAVVRYFAVWLAANYLVLGVGLELRGLDVPIPQMIVAGVLLMFGLLNLVAYTGGERRLRNHISKVARTDPLTGLANRRALEETLTEHLQRVATEGAQLTVLIADIDHFKRLNDQFGHLAADSVLEEVGQMLRTVAREDDLVARYGGDEFVIVIPGEENALLLGERLRQQIARSELCTISVGISQARGREVAVDDFLCEADEALLLAKRSGRNCVKLASAVLRQAA